MIPIDRGGGGWGTKPVNIRKNGRESGARGLAFSDLHQQIHNRRRTPDDKVLGFSERLATSPQLLFPLHYTGLGARVEIVSDQLHRQRPIFGRHGVADLSYGALAIHEVDDFIGIELRLIADIQ